MVAARRIGTRVTDPVGMYGRDGIIPVHWIRFTCGRPYVTRKIKGQKIREKIRGQTEQPPWLTLGVALSVPSIRCPNATDSACLAAKIEQTFHSGSAAYPVERTLLTCGVLEACLHSRHKLNQQLETPHLAVSYQPPADSPYARS